MTRPPAIFSPCRKYRYALWREWDMLNSSYAMFIGLNPSTADETQDDPTIRRCVDYAKRWGYGALCMTNLFAWRDTKPVDMMKEENPIGDDNDKWIHTLAAHANIVIASWGKHGCHLDRATEVRMLVTSLNYLHLNQDGSPAHPLYLKSSLTPKLYTPLKLINK